MLTYILATGIATPSWTPKFRFMSLLNGLSVMGQIIHLAFISAISFSISLLTMWQVEGGTEWTCCRRLLLDLLWLTLHLFFFFLDKKKKIKKYKIILWCCWHQVILYGENKGIPRTFHRLTFFFLHVCFSSKWIAQKPLMWFCGFWSLEPKYRNGLLLNNLIWYHLTIYHYFSKTEADNY